MRLVILSLFTCVVFSGQLFAQEKDQKATSDSKTAAVEVQYQSIKTPTIANTLDSLKLHESILQNIGYGYQKRDHVTGSISSVNISSLQSAPYSNLAEYLIGRVPGVLVSKDPSNPNGYRIQIRGVNSINFQGEPLFVIDGMPVSAESALTMTDPQDIASVDVIKDGTAAIYGTRGANGVILITTKK
ncbi:MAG TPA: TonB-dependent receptor plug domain-containing protein [Balneolales bacterium]|nr:TonB-dependent receptor plug domain-containing protein [Balneolales bacterium]